MMKWVLCVVLSASAQAAVAEPWLCTGPDGAKVFSYEPESARSRSCVDHPIPSGNVWRKHSDSDTQQTPATFPRVDARSQKQRDATRRRILERELEEEKKSLAAAIRELAEQKQARVSNARNPAAADVRLYEERIRIHQTNIANLQKELGRAG